MIGISKQPRYCFFSRAPGVILMSSHVLKQLDYVMIIYFYLACFTREGNGTLLQYSCLESPMDGGAWWAVVHGVSKGRTRLSDFTFTFHFPSLEKEMTTHSSALAWRIPGMGEPGGLPSMGSHRVGHDWRDLAAAAVCFTSSAPYSMLPFHLVCFLISLSLSFQKFFPKPLSSTEEKLLYTYYK